MTAETAFSLLPLTASFRTSPNRTKSWKTRSLPPSDTPVWATAGSRSPRCASTSSPALHAPSADLESSRRGTRIFLQVILGTMSYGVKGWADWVLEEEEAIPHFQAAWEAGVNTWGESLTQCMVECTLLTLLCSTDTANVVSHLFGPHSSLPRPRRAFAVLKSARSYSNTPDWLLTFPLNPPTRSTRTENQSESSARRSRRLACPVRRL